LNVWVTALRVAGDIAKASESSIETTRSRDE